jgi:hypothetical protein
VLAAMALASAMSIACSRRSLDPEGYVRRLLARLVLEARQPLRQQAARYSWKRRRSSPPPTYVGRSGREPRRTAGGLFGRIGIGFRFSR